MQFNVSTTDSSTDIETKFNLTSHNTSTDAIMIAAVILQRKRRKDGNISLYIMSLMYPQKKYSICVKSGFSEGQPIGPSLHSVAPKWGDARSSRIMRLSASATISGNTKLSINCDGAFVEKEGFNNSVQHDATTHVYRACGLSLPQILKLCQFTTPCVWVVTSVNLPNRMLWNALSGVLWLLLAYLVNALDTTYEYTYQLEHLFNIPA